MSSSNSRSIDNFFALTNTNLGVEQDRAEAVETRLFTALSAYVTSNDGVNFNTSVANNSQFASITSSLSTLASSIGTIQAQSAADEGLSTAEVTRALAAEAVLTSTIATVDQNVTSESARAVAAEQANAADNATNATAIGANSASITSLLTSRDSDESNIASLMSSRLSDESHIDSMGQSIASIQSTQSIDEANITSEIARATAAESALGASITSNGVAIASVAADVTAAATALATSVTTATVNTSAINSTGPLVLSTTGDVYGTALLVINNGNDCNGVTLDTSGLSTNPDLGDFVIKTVDRQMLMRFEGRPANLVDSSNAAIGELTFGSGGTASRPATTLYCGAANSGIAQGNFTIKAGIITDINDQDVTLNGTWSNFNNYAADMRLVRKGSIVTVTLMPFCAQSEADSSIAAYSLAIPSWAIPQNPVECCVVVATNGYRSVGCCLLNARNSFCLLPFTGMWKGYGGLNQATSFSYLVGGPAPSVQAPVIPSGPGANQRDVKP